MQVIFRDGNKSYSGTESRIPAGRRFGIVRHPEWHEVIINGVPAASQPSAMQMQDRPIGDGKGNTIPISDKWWSHIRKINNDAGYGYARQVGLLWINIPYTDKTPRAETVISGGNFIAWDEETNTHVKLLSYGWDMDTSVLSPQYHNWLQLPYMFWKCSSYTQAGYTMKVLDGVDCYIPRIALTELWINKNSIEIFPVGYNYQFLGSNVYDGDSPLFTITNGVKKFHTDWRFTINPVFK